MVSKKKKDETDETVDAAVEAGTETEAVDETPVEAGAGETEGTVEAGAETAEAEVEAKSDDTAAEETVEAAPAGEEAAEPVEAAPAEEEKPKKAPAKKAAPKAEKKAAPKTEGEAPVKKSGKRAEKIGVVKSDKMTKTVVVRVDRLVKHPIYRKYVKKRKNFMAHDELGAKTGDKVRIVETRPLSARKRWRVIEIIQKAER
jgi:small subunit ribosomal protein S17